MSDGAHV